MFLCSRTLFTPELFWSLIKLPVSSLRKASAYVPMINRELLIADVAHRANNIRDGLNCNALVLAA
eukprot:4775495-Heterocapsa_arctica.AAC.1